jgi:putative ABC transport system permease protein
MIGKETIKYSLKNLTTRKSRSILTIFSIFLGISTIFIFISFGLGLYNYVNQFTTGSSADKITIQTKGGTIPGLDETFSLGEEDLKAILRSSGVYDATGISFKVAEVIKNDVRRYAFLIGMDPKKPMMQEMGNVKLFLGRELQSGDNGKVVLGYNYLLPDKIFPTPFELNQDIEIQGKKLKIIGFYESIGNPQDDSQIYILEDYLGSLYGNKTKSYGMIIAKVDTDRIREVIENVEKSLRHSRNQEIGKEDFYVASFEDLLKTYTSALNIIIGFIILIALISVIVSAINTANTMITSVLERVREIGVIKSIGARNSEILKIFLFESSFLGFVAGVIGVLWGWTLSAFGGKILADLGWSFLAPFYSWQLFVGCVIFATLTGAISGAIPAINASRINPVDALRYE